MWESGRTEAFNAGCSGLEDNYKNGLLRLFKASNYEARYLKINGDSIRRVLQNILVDLASLVFISAALYFISSAVLMLYTSYYRTAGLATPDSFSLAMSQL